VSVMGEIDNQEIQRAKEALGVRAKDIIADGLGLVEQRGKVLCPLHKEKTPSMSWFREGLMWRCHGCRGTIDIYDYLTKNRGMSFRKAHEEVLAMAGGVTPTTKNHAPIAETFRVPDIDKRPLGEKGLGYMKHRCLEVETLEHWRVRERTWVHWDGKKEISDEVFVFPYFETSDSSLVYVSYRELVNAGEKGFKGGCEPKTKSILWGMWHCDSELPLVITEGQLDAMSIWQAGYKNVVSIPGGAQNDNWITHCWEWLLKFKDIIVFADNDVEGLKFADATKIRIPNVTVIFSEKYKDANSILMDGKPDLIMQMIDEALKKVPEGLLDVSQIEYRMAEARESESIETGFYDLDKELNDLKTGEITIVFGRNNEGKSTFISQMIAHSLEKDVPVFLFSGEISVQKTQEWIYMQMVGGNESFLQRKHLKYKVKIEPAGYAIKAIKEWHSGKFFMFDLSSQNASDKDFLFERMKLCVQKYGVRLLVIDNLMSSIYENASSLYSDQANFVQDCKIFATTNNVHVVLVAHPNKIKAEVMPNEKDYNIVVGNLEKTDISGTNNIANKADNIIAVERVWGDRRPCDALITCLKNREDGQRFTVRYFFSLKTLRFHNSRTLETYKYGWIKHLDQKYNEEIVTELVDTTYTEF